MQRIALASCRPGSGKGRHFQACSAHLASEKEAIVSYFAEKTEAIKKELPCAPTAAPPRPPQRSHPRPSLPGVWGRPGPSKTQPPRPESLPTAGHSLQPLLGPTPAGRGLPPLTLPLAPPAPLFPFQAVSSLLWSIENTSADRMLLNPGAHPQRSSWDQGSSSSTEHHGPSGNPFLLGPLPPSPTAGRRTAAPLPPLLSPPVTAAPMLVSPRGCSKSPTLLSYRSGGPKSRQIPRA